jgi:hypothetical protein
MCFYIGVQKYRKKSSFTKDVIFGCSPNVARYPVAKNRGLDSSTILQYCRFLFIIPGLSFIRALRHGWQGLKILMMPVAKQVKGQEI